jgi:hypothetical protein
VGGLDVFIPYMRDYVKTFNGTSITTEQWRAHLFHYFGSLKDGDEYLQKLGTVDWEGVSPRPLHLSRGTFVSCMAWVSTRSEVLII